jgi:hypothetical protein
MTEALKKPAPQPAIAKPEASSDPVFVSRMGSEPLTTATASPKPVEAAVAKRKPKDNAAQSATTPSPMVAKSEDVYQDSNELDV